MSWEDYFRAVEANDLTRAFDALVSVGALPLMIGADDKGKYKDPGVNGKGWGVSTIEQRRKRLVDSIAKGRKVGLGCQPIGYVVIDIDTPDKDRNLIDTATEETRAIVFAGNMPPTLTIGTQGGRHLWFIAPKSLIEFWGDKGKQEIKLPSGGAAEIFLGIATKQTQVAVPPSDGKAIEVEMEPVMLPDWAVDSIIFHLLPPKKSIFPAAVRNVASGSDEEDWYRRHTEKIVDGIARALHPERHKKFRNGAFVLAGYATGIGCHHLREWATSRVREAHKYAKPEVSPLVLGMTPETAWTIGSRESLLPNWIIRKQKGMPYSKESVEEAHDLAAAEQVDPIVREDPDLVSFSNPHKLARDWIAAQSIEQVIYWQGEFWQWSMGRYESIPDEEMDSRLSRWIDGVFATAAKDQFFQTQDPKERAKIRVKSVTPGVVESVRKAIASLTTKEVREIDAMPAWILPRDDWDVRDVVCMRNAIINPRLGGIETLTPNLFSRYRTDYDWINDAAKPKRWLEFLRGIWPDEKDCIEALQMWFGYVLTQDTRMQKILLLIGPPRSGKGTISRIITAMVGTGNVASPSLGDLAQPFGLARCIGRPLAIIPDARIGNRIDQAVIVERLLSISGEDRVAIDRKYRESWEGRLPTRLMICSNELPRLQDTTGALPNRYIVLPMTKSFLGSEDRELESDILKELPGIVTWAIDGFQKLAKAGRFTQPESGKVRLKVLEELCSPIVAFVSDHYLVTGSDKDRIPADNIQANWKQWCEETGHFPGSVHRFVKDLTDAYPAVSKKKIRSTDSVTWGYVGIEKKSD